MWFDDHPYVTIYLVGCFLTLFLNIFKIVLFQAIGWLHKDNILRKNHKKLLQPDQTSFSDRAAAFLILVLFEAALSWINVPILLWQMGVGLLAVVRELLSSTPEEIKLLRFPLRNNPDMPREAVWAYITALRLKTGMQWDEQTVRYELNNLADLYPSFNRISALKQLCSLNAISPEALSAILRRLNTENDEINSW